MLEISKKLQDYFGMSNLHEDENNFHTKLLEDFTISRFLIEQSHTGDLSNIRRDILRQFATPHYYDLYEEAHHLTWLYEANYFLNFSPLRQPEEKHFDLLESLEGRSGPKSSFVKMKTLGIFPEMVVSESELQEVAKISSRIMLQRPVWLQLPDLRSTTISEDRQNQIMAISYAYARVQDFLHEESVEYAKEVLLNEYCWSSYTYRVPPSSIIQKRQFGDNRRYVNGLRIQAGGKAGKNRMKRMQQRIIQSKRNRRGVGKKIASVRQMVQRKEALKKANAAHKGVKGARLHKALGKNLHLSKGMVQKNESFKDFKIQENSLRLYEDGSKYVQHPIFEFSFLTEHLLESRLHPGQVHVLRGDAISTIYFSSGRDFRLGVGTKIKILDLIDAKSWRGNYPSNPIGQFIVEVEVLSGPHEGENVQFDGSDLALALGIDEVFLDNPYIVERRDIVSTMLSPEEEENFYKKKEALMHHHSAVKLNINRTRDASDDWEWKANSDQRWDLQRIDRDIQISYNQLLQHYGLPLDYLYPTDTIFRHNTRDLLGESVYTELAKGGVYFQLKEGIVKEVVISVFECLLQEEQVGAILRAIKRKAPLTEDTVVRVYNDTPDHFNLMQEMFLSSKLHSNTIVEDNSVGLIFEESPRMKALRLKYDNERQNSKVNYQATKDSIRQSSREDKEIQIQRAREQHRRDKERAKEQYELEKSRIRESLCERVIPEVFLDINKIKQLYSR